MTPEQASTILQMTLPNVESEYWTTRRVLAAVPDDQGGYKPHEKNMSALELTQHIAFTEIWFLESIVRGEFLRPDDGDMLKLETASQVVKVYDEAIPRLLKQAAALPGEHLAREAQFFTFKYPLVVYLNFMTSHSIHHRGQLSVYLRPMGAKVPSIYGGSADEPMTATQQA